MDFLKKMFNWCLKNGLSFLFAISCAGFCLFISYYGDSGGRILQKHIVLISFGAVLISAFFIDYFCKITKAVRDNQKFAINIFAALFSFVAVICTYPNSDAFARIKEVAAGLSFIFLYFVFYLSISVLAKYLREFYSKTKGRRFWIEVSVFGGYVLLIMITSAIVNSHTNLFSAVGGRMDMFLSADTFRIIPNAFFNSTKISDPTFPNHLFPYIATLPFATIAKLTSFIFFFINDSYVFCLVAMQAVCLYLTAIMLAEMMGLKKTYRWLFVALFLCLAPSFIFVFVIEEFIIGAFWLVLALFLSSKKLNSRHAHSLASGIQTPSIFMTPFMTSLFRDFTLKNLSRKNIKKDLLTFCLDMLKAGAWVLFLLVLTGRSYLLLNAVKDFLSPDVATHIEIYSGGTLREKIVAFTHMIANFFYCPAWETDGNIICTPQSTVSIFGIICLVLVLISFAVNYKKPLAWCCLAWVGISAFLIVVLGMGVPRFEPFLYSNYFVWAYITLLFMGFYKLLSWAGTKWSKTNYVAYGVLGAVILALFVYNIINLVEIIQLGVKDFAI